MAIMAAFEMFLAEEAAAAAATEIGTAAAAAEAANLAATALTAGELAGLGATVGEGAMAAAPGINQAAIAADAAAGGAGAGQAGINAAQVGANQSAATQIANSGLPQGFEQQLQNVQNLGQGPAVQVASTNPAAGLESLNQPVSRGITSVPPAANTLPMGIDMPGTYMPPSNALYTPPATTYMAPEPSPLMKGLDSATKWASAHPFQAATAAYTGANVLGLLNPSGATFNNTPYSGPLNKYRLSDDFRAGSTNPQDFQYTPRRYVTGGGVMGDDPYSIPVGYAEGNDVQGYAKGGSLSESIESYQRMLAGKPMEAPSVSRDVGIYYDQDPDTRYQDALTAAQIRQAKVNQRAYVSPPAAKRPTPMGQLQMASVKPRKQGGGDDVEAAQGGIMQSYADGGITGEGNLNLQIPLNLGGGSGGGAGGGFGGYTPAGGGNVNPNTGGGGFSGGKPQGDFGGLAGLLGGAGVDGTTAGNLMNRLQQLQQQQMDQPYGGGILGRGDMLVGMGGTAENGYMSPGGMDMGMFSHGPNPFMSTTRDPFPGKHFSELTPEERHISEISRFATGGIAGSSLGSYAAGGNPRLLKGPGDGMSDNIPATINGRQPARLADGEFVVPADVVSHLGNGSTEAGAKQLHAMMDKVRSARTGNKKQGKQIKPQKYLPK